MRQQFTAPNGDSVWVEVPSVERMRASERSSELTRRLGEYRREVYVKTGRMPSARSVYEMRRRAWGK